MKFILTLSCVLFISYSFSQAKNEFDLSCIPSRESTNLIEQEWIDLDIERIESVFNLIPEFSADFKSLQALLPHLIKGRANHYRSRHDLGEDLQLLKYTLYGGAGSIQFEILHSEEIVLQVNQYISGYTNLIRDHYIDHITVPLTCENGRVENITINEENCRLYREKHPQSLIGDSVQYSAPHDKNAFDFFSKINNAMVMDYGSSGMHNYWDSALVHIDYLVSSKNQALLERLLYSSVEHGRIFSAGALSYLSNENQISLGKEALEQIDRIVEKNSLVSLYIPAMCMGQTYPYDVYGDFEEMLTGYRSEGSFYPESILDVKRR